MPADFAQLQPLHALLDPDYPESLRTIAEWLFIQAVEDEELPLLGERLTQLAMLALRQVERLSREEGGRNFYLGRGMRYRESVRDKKMYAEFNGRNYNDLARKYYLTATRVRQIVDLMHTNDLARRQGTLDLSL